MPANPDGYSGNCSVIEGVNGNILETVGETSYIHYGVPLGEINYSAKAQGNGVISIYLIKSKSAEALTDLELFISIQLKPIVKKWNIYYKIFKDKK